MKYKWIIKEPNEIKREFLAACHDSEIIARLLLNRGINTEEKANEFLNPSCYKASAPEEIPNLIKAKDRILEAIKKKVKITIFGDYDVDGVTATSCLLITLREFTDNVDFYIPNRLSEGYGLNNEAVKTISKEHKAKLLITCDCGITNVKEIELANSLGMDVIVTDHHSLPEVLPRAYAVLNPKLLPEEHKLYWLPGVGVAYKLAEAILSKSSELRAPSSKLSALSLVDLVCLGMIADLAPLVAENRYLVQIGLPKLASTNKVGLKELLNVCGIPLASRFSSFSSDHVGFGIAPRINAIGRLADANLAVKLLTTNNELEAAQIAHELDLQNIERQVLCEEILNEALELIKATSDKHQATKCIVLAKDTWHHGVIGIVASRIVEKFNLPTILIAIDKEQNIARGSGRSIEQLNIIDAIVSSSTYLEKYGGHKAACGLSVKIENIDKFISHFEDTVNSMLAGICLEPILKIDFELPLSSLSLDLVTKINKLSPFGLGNPLPVFTSDQVEITSVRKIGKNNKHLKLSVKSDAKNHLLSIHQIGTSPVRYFETLIWNFDNSYEFKVKDKIRFAYTPKINNYNGETFIQLEAKDWQILESSSIPAYTHTGREEKENVVLKAL